MRIKTKAKERLEWCVRGLLCTFWVYFLGVYNQTKLVWYGMVHIDSAIANIINKCSVLV